MNEDELIYGDLTRKIIGAVFEVHNNSGSGLLEKHYQRALAEELRRKEIKFVEQYPVELNYKDISIGKYFLDFFIEDKLVLEIKSTPHFSRDHIEQTLNYLKSLDLKLGLLVHFGKDGAKFKRIVNIR